MICSFLFIMLGGLSVLFLRDAFRKGNDGSFVLGLIFCVFAVVSSVIDAYAIRNTLQDWDREYTMVMDIHYYDKTVRKVLKSNRKSISVIYCDGYTKIYTSDGCETTNGQGEIISYTYKKK